jgi:hypothetical protein
MDTKEKWTRIHCLTFLESKKSILLRKLNEAVSFENFYTLNMWQNVFTGRAGENRHSLNSDRYSNEKLPKEQFVMGMAHRGRLNILTNIFGNLPRYFRRIRKVKITIKKYFDDESITRTPDRQQQEKNQLST